MKKKLYIIQNKDSNYKNYYSIVDDNFTTYRSFSNYKRDKNIEKILNAK